MPQRITPWKVRQHRRVCADSHTHLDRYPDDEVAAMVRRAYLAGAELILTVGVDAASSRRAAHLAGQHVTLFAAAGLHPLRVRPETWRHETGEIATLLHGGLFCAVGEIGIDASEGAAALNTQIAAFEAQLDPARGTALPVVVHSVGAHRRVAEVLERARPRLPAVIIHSFNGDEADLHRFLDLDCHVSFGRLMLKPGHEELRRLACRVPLDRLLVETDTYPLPGRSTEPRDAVDVVRLLCALRDEGSHAVAAATIRNFNQIMPCIEPHIDW